MKILQRTGLPLIMIMTIVLPFWLTFGRNFMGSYGWLTISYIFFIAPVLFVTMLILIVLLWMRKDVRQKVALDTIDSLLLLVLYVAVFLHGFFLVDGGDIPESFNSVMTVVFGRDLLGLSSLLGQVTFWISCLLLLSCLVVFIYKLIKKQPTR